MSFIWPAVLVLLLAIPLGIAVYVTRERRRRARVAAALGPLRTAATRWWRSRAAYPPHDPGGPARHRVGRARRGDGASRERHRRAALRGDRRPRLRRVGQHGGDRHPADPDGGRQGRRARIRVAPARVDPDRRGRVQRRGFLGDRPDRRPERRARRDRSSRARARDVGRARDPVLADGDRDGRAGPPGWLLHEQARRTRPSSRRSCRPGTLRPGGDRAAQRRREQPAARSARWPRGAPPSAGSASSRSGSGPRPARRSRSRGSASTAALDETALRQIADITDGTYYAASEPDQLTSIYDDIETRFVIRPEATEITSLHGRGGSRPAGARRRWRVSSGSGGCHDRLPRRRGRWHSWSPSCRSSSSRGPGCSAGASPRCAIRACRSCARRSVGRRGSAATCRSRCSRSGSSASSSRWPVPSRS